MIRCLSLALKILIFAMLSIAIYKFTFNPTSSIILRRKMLITPITNASQKTLYKAQVSASTSEIYIYCPTILKVKGFFVDGQHSPYFRPARIIFRLTEGSFRDLNVVISSTDISAKILVLITGKSDSRNVKVFHSLNSRGAPSAEKLDLDIANPQISENLKIQGWVELNAQRAPDSTSPVHEWCFDMNYNFDEKGNN